MAHASVGCVFMADKAFKDFDDAVEPVEEDVVETVEDDEAAEDAVEEAVTTVALADDYEGPTPVFISTGSVDRVELTSKGVEVPVADSVSLLELPFVVDPNAKSERGAD